jgi:hypothetical protein
MASEKNVSPEVAAAAEEKNTPSGTAAVNETLVRFVDDLDDDIEAEDVKESEEDNTSIPSIESNTSPPVVPEPADAAKKSLLLDELHDVHELITERLPYDKEIYGVHGMLPRPEFKISALTQSLLEMKDALLTTPAEITTGIDELNTIHKYIVMCWARDAKRFIGSNTKPPP